MKGSVLIAAAAGATALGVAVPAIASRSSSPRAHASKAHCVVVRRHHVRTRICGVRGPRGPKGSTGARGARGPRGARGARGATGPAGAAGTARAFARVLPGATPALDSVRMLGFTGVRHVGTGVYCLTPAPGTGADERKQAAVVTVDLAGTTTGTADNGAFVVAGGPDCNAGPPGEFEVKTFTGTPLAADDRVAFDIVVP